MIQSYKSLIAVAVISVVGLSGISMCSPKVSVDGDKTSSTKARQEADRDTAADSLTTITAQTRETRDIVETEKAARRELTDQIQKEYKALTRTMTENAEQARRQAEIKAGELKTELLALQKRLAEAEKKADTKPPLALTHKLPTLPVTPKVVTSPKPGLRADAYQWIEPIDMKRVAQSRSTIRNGGLLSNVSNGRAPGKLFNGATVSREGGGRPKVTAPPSLLGMGRTDEQGVTVPEGSTGVTEEGLRRAYTIPENSTLIGAQAMTGLFGRIPVSGRVRDALPFRIITGAENLASQGFEIPNLEGAIWRGVATGDRTLRCVEGRLVSVTFIFEDGTVRTVRGRVDKPLGTLIDDRGYPCVPGTYITDAPRHIAGIASAGAALGAAGAIADREVTRRSGRNGGSTAVTGDAGRYVLGSAAEDAFEEIAQTLRDRMKESFDAVIVQPGAIVALAVDTEIQIDYDANGRRIDHLDLPHQVGDSQSPADQAQQQKINSEDNIIWKQPAGVSQDAPQTAAIRQEERE